MYIGRLAEWSKTKQITQKRYFVFWEYARCKAWGEKETRNLYRSYVENVAGILDLLTSSEALWVTNGRPCGMSGIVNLVECRNSRINLSNSFECTCESRSIDLTASIFLRESHWDCMIRGWNLADNQSLIFRYCIKNMVEVKTYVESSNISKIPALNKNILLIQSLRVQLDDHI